MNCGIPAGCTWRKTTQAPTGTSVELRPKQEKSLVSYLRGTESLLPRVHYLSTIIFSPLATHVQRLSFPTELPFLEVLCIKNEPPYVKARLFALSTKMRNLASQFDDVHILSWAKYLGKNLEWIENFENGFRTVSEITLLERDHCNLETGQKENAVSWVGSYPDPQLPLLTAASGTQLTSTGLSVMNSVRTVRLTILLSAKPSWTDRINLQGKKEWKRTI